MGRGSSGAGARAKGVRASKGAGGGGGPAGGSASAGKFGRTASPTVLFTPGTSDADIKAATAAARKMFGKNFQIEDFASLSGAPDNARVIVEFNPTGNILTGMGKPSFTVFVNHSQLFEMQRTFSVNARGQKVIKNDIFETAEKGTGLGLKLFARQVENATAAGFKEIKTDAAQGTMYNGYYTWARYGYNAKLDKGTRSILPENLKGVRSMHELFKTKAGRDWWKNSGDSTRMRFNLAPNSRSQRILSDYVRDRGL